MADPFWDFSCAFYARPGVQAACIALQDEYGADVDVVLFALWCASLGHRLTEAELATVDARVATWRSAVVQPIRQLRRATKTPPEEFDTGALHRQLLNAELEAERLQQHAMQRHAPPPGTAPPAEAAWDNLALIPGIPPNTPAVATLLQAFP